MLNRFSKDLNEITIGCEKEQLISSEECSELDTTAAAVVFSNSQLTMMDMIMSRMMDNTFKKCSIYYYFSSTFEICVFGLLLL